MIATFHSIKANGLYTHTKPFYGHIHVGQPALVHTPT